MKSRYLFLLVYLLGTILGGSSAQGSLRCTTCDLEEDATSSFLQCVGLPSTDEGKEHVQNLKKMLEGTWDIYTFMKSSMTDVPLLSLDGALELNPEADVLQNEALVQMWVEIKMKPLLQSITKHFLSCLSTKNFSCSTYQIILKELSQYYSEMSPVRQKWIYTFFIYPFLSGDGVAGCVNPYESTEDWLIKNFGAFRAMARLEDFSTINMVFSGLEVLHLLSPTQKAELLLSPEVQNVDNGTLTLIFHSLLTGESAPSPSGNLTVLPSTHNPYSSHSPLSDIVSGFNTAFTTIGSFAHEFVSFTSQRNLSEIKSTTLTQFLLNFTLAELANIYEQKNTTDTSETQLFDVTSVEDWYQLAVIPVLQRFWPNEGDLMHQNITLAFHELFFLNNSMNNESSEIKDVCSLILDQASCGLTDAVENVAHVLHCAARSNLTLTETTVLGLINELMSRLNTLIKELSTANFEELISDFREIFTERDSPSLIQQHLEDPEYIKLWFQIKLLPLLPDVDPNLLSCLSTKNFSCPAYQTLVAALDERMIFTDADPIYSYNIYKFFIYSFLVEHNNSDSQCISSANQSAEWLMNNFGSFLRFASITDFYELNPYFSGLEALTVLTPKQLAELLLLPLRTPPEKDVVIDRVFDFLLESPKMWRFSDVLLYVVELAEEVSLPCSVYRQIFDRTYRAIPFVSVDMEPVIWARIDDLINIAPEECVPLNVMCPETQINETNICSGIDSSDLQSYLNTSMHISCNFNLQKYACAELDSFTANQLASLMMCDLPGNSSRSKVLWKLLLTHLSSVLDPSLDILANVSISMIGPAGQEILDVIGELRLWLLTDEQLGNSEIIQLWFSDRLSGFLPFASGRFLHCLNNRNISCQSYQQILQVYNHQFENMSSEQQQVVLNSFVLLFLSAPHSGPGCVSFVNSSAEWLRNNFGSFSEFLSVRQLFDLNPQFNPLEALQLLTPKQSAELLVLNHPTLSNKDVLINVLFDFLTESPAQRKLPEFLSHLVLFLPMGNLSCSSYKTLFTRLDEAVSGASSDVASSILSSKLSLVQLIPPGCIIYSGECNVTIINETDICKGVNSTQLQLHLSSGMLSGHFCDFAVEEFACASLSALTTQDLAELLKCNRLSNSSGSTAAWKLLLSKASPVLNQALDLLANTTLDPGSPSVSMILDAIREIWLDGVNMGTFNDSSFIQLWFNHRLRPFLPAVSSDFLSCLSTKVLDCSPYQLILQILSEVRPQMTPATQMLVYTHFVEVYLTRNDTADPGCRSNINSSTEWLQRNLGGFFILLSIQEIQRLYPDFSALDALSQLTPTQLAQVSATPGLLTSADQVAMVMRLVPDRLFASFFDDLAAAIMGHENMLPSSVRSAFLDSVFARANLSYPGVDDSVVLLWLQHRLPPLLINLSPRHVMPYFQILAGRNCSIEQQGVENLNSTISTLSEDSQQEIYNHIILTLQGPLSLRCYGNNYNTSFYHFIERSFMGFQFPNLTTFLSLIPQDQKRQLINSIPPSHLGDFLRRPNVVDNEAQLCELYSSYDQTPILLENESLPAEVGRPTLSCVWPMALSTSIRSEVNAWFDRSLQNYLVFLTKRLLSSDATFNASCVAFQKLILVLDKFNYTATDFERRDVFDTISVYLTSAATTPRCYNANDPELNSTAWFAEYIGPFMSFLTLEVLQSFGPEEVLQIFTVNPLNIALLNHSVLPQNLTDYYTQLVYQQDSNFDPLLLPLLCRCVAPGLAFTQLTAEESMIILQNLTTVCTDLDPQIFAALTSTFVDNIDATTISALGNQSTSISMGQLWKILPQTLRNTLNILASVIGWSEGQTRAIVQSLLSSGVFQVNSSSSLLTLGSLVVGVPSRVFLSISSSEILTASTHSSLVEYIKLGPNVIQQTFVSQIISVNNNNEMIIQNVPDELATEIAPVLLQGFTVSSSVVTTLNRKTWKKQQAELFFNIIAVENATAELGGPNNLTSSVLQGFTCTSVRTISRVQVKKLIKACRRTAQNKVTLDETQLTCMYNYISGDVDATSFDIYPPDMLLYYDYSLVPPSSCRFYFEQLGSADFSIFSSALSYKRTTLFDNARSCLGITTTNLTQDNIAVLGNMCCILDKSYIINSDPSILEKLKTCPDLTDAQAAAVEFLLIGGNTTYGAPSTWSEKTLFSLEPLPLYLSSAFYINFSKKAKHIFLKGFLKVIKRNGVSQQKRRKMNSEIRKSNMIRIKRATDTDCTVGQITQVTISDDTFPFDYVDINQFNNCLTAATVRDNLEAITQKVDQQDYLQIVLSKLREAYNSTIPENQVQVLGPASRVGTLSDIGLWSITQIDTLAALMDSANGEWDPNLVKAIISKYLSIGGNTLGSAELIAIGGPNLCYLDIDVLGSISPQSLKNANTLDVSNCTTDKVEKLFNISTAAFLTSRQTVIPVSAYQLQQPFISGATSGYILSLVNSNINMDMATFVRINTSIIQSLTVRDVKNLLGTNLPDLKLYENQTVAQSWISSQLQSDLNTLGLNLVGRADIITSTLTPSSASNTTTPSSASNTTTPSSASNTTTPSSASNTLTPSSASNTTTPSSASNTTTPSSASNTTTPSSASNTTTPSSSSNTTTRTTASVTLKPATTSTTKTTAATIKAAGIRIQANAGFTFLVFIALLISSQQILL